MRPTRRFALWILLFPFVFASAPIPMAISCLASQNSHYLSKEYVDTVVQEAFNSLNAAMSIPGADFKHKNAIKEARRVAQRLKRLAAGDPNEKYVLFRVSELEQQLWLEDRDLALQNEQKTQKIKNCYIDTFNLELGSKRPSFSTLARLTDRMASLDPAKAEEMKASRMQRSLSISREIRYRIERAFVSGDAAAARAEMDYCSKNRSFLRIPDSTFTIMSGRSRLQGEALQQRALINETIIRADKNLAKNRLGDAWEGIAALRATLDRVRRGLPLSDWNRYEGRSKALTARAVHKDDSLVMVTITIYKAKGEDAALAYIENVLKKIGVSRDRIAGISDFVLSHGAKKPLCDSAVARELEPASGESGEAEIDIDNIRELAKEKARQRADSIRAEGEASADALTQKIYSLLEAGKIDDAFASFNGNLTLLETYIYKDALSTLSSAVTKAYLERRDLAQPIASVAPSTTADDFKKNQEKAAWHINRIYSLLENGNALEAYRQFERFRDKLKEYGCKEAFDMLEASVTQAYAARTSESAPRAGK